MKLTYASRSTLRSMAVAKCLDDSVCWVCEFVCILNNAQGIRYVLLGLGISTFILQALFFFPSHNLLDTFIFSITFFKRRLQ